MHCIAGGGDTAANHHSGEARKHRSMAGVAVGPFTQEHVTKAAKAAPFAHLGTAVYEAALGQAPQRAAGNGVRGLSAAPSRFQR